MAIDVGKEVAALQRLGVALLRERYAEVFGESTTARNKAWLVRRIAWRIQANAEGDLSERAWAAEQARAQSSGPSRGAHPQRGEHAHDPADHQSDISCSDPILRRCRFARCKLEESSTDVAILCHTNRFIRYDFADHPS